MPGGAIGVSIFFCLSGFLITQILIGLPTLSLSNLAKFVFRRWMRIYPLYVAALAATYLLMRNYRPEWLEEFTSALPGMLTFTHIPSGTGFATAVRWTLHVEFWFYVFFPFIFALTFRRGLLPLAIGLLIVATSCKDFCWTCRAGEVADRERPMADRYLSRSTHVWRHLRSFDCETFPLDTNLCF